MQDELFNHLESKLNNYEVSKGEPLLYDIIIDSNYEIQPKNIETPSRGDYAFQTDILIKKGKTPLLVLELKYNSLTTHNILTYSAKALKHKGVFPYLRYGLIVGNKPSVDRRFFIHNEGFDFYYTTMNIEDDIDEILEMIYTQINAAESLIDILEKTGKRPKGYSNISKFY